MESHWGLLYPDKLPDGDTKETAAEKIKAVLFTRGAGQQFKTFRKTLKDNHMTKSGEYPATVADAIGLMSEADRDAPPKPKPSNNLRRSTTGNETSHATTTITDDESSSSGQRRSILRNRVPTPARRRCGGAFQPDDEDEPTSQSPFQR